MDTQAALNAHREYAAGVAKLMLWYVRRLVRVEGMAFGEAVASRVGLYPLTTFHAPADVDGWNAVRDELAALFDSCADRADTDEFETRALALLWPHIEPEIAPAVARAGQWLQEAHGCFQHEYRPFYAEP